MTTNETPPTTEAELSARLNELLQQADANGIDVKGGYECFNDGDHPDWDVVIAEVQKKEVSD